LLRGSVSPGSPLRLVISPGAADFVNGVANGLDSAQPLVSSGGEGAAAPDPAPTPRGPSVEETLSRFVGMESVKTLVKSVAQQSGFNAQLKAKGHPARHKRMAFFIDGNPGTGKTKIAEALHGLLISSGTLLPDAPFISVNAASMEGQHLGEARVNTDAKILQAKGGLLFCDEVTCPTYIVVVGAMVWAVCEEANPEPLFVIGAPADQQEDEHLRSAGRRGAPRRLDRRLHAPRRRAHLRLRRCGRLHAQPSAPVPSG
jgi:hypothetical protein